MTVVAVLNATATDRFYIDDFRIGPGDTKLVSINLDNESQYSAFQADLYLPAGLSVVQVDGMYDFSLTSRKGTDHSLVSQPLSNGAIRLLSYSMRVNAYSGNSGALVTFRVKAATDFEGPAYIELKNMLFTKPTRPTAIEVPFDDEVCTVTKGLRGDVNADGFVNPADLPALIDYLLDGVADPFSYYGADVNGDGVIEAYDLTFLIDILLNE